MNKTGVYGVVEEVIRFLVASYKRQPTLEEIAAHVHMSPFHLQRTFKEWAGISPKKFVQYLTLEALKGEIHQTGNMIAAADRVGLSSQSRVYDLFISMEAVTPGEFKTRGRGMTIEYGIHHSPFGNCFVAVTQRGICKMGFIDGQVQQILDELQQQWGLAVIKQNQESTFPLIRQIFYTHRNDVPFHLLVRGTDFQVRVWEALLKIPFGQLASYQTIAQAAGMPKATRAVGTAIANNPVAFLIPCHRVIRSEGVIGNYHWGPSRKAAMIGWEKAMKSEK
jgi:AraC family transcriptional regulator, regulatory protein of adaptative response / methylated-DNA-[protein]-cysteine methyltransferase